ncbi:MAG: TetR/AcrR family transcriptional regulator [Acidobacteriota bacterium]
MAHEFAHLDKKGRARAKKIGKAAARVFSRKGYVEATMDEIAAAARISKGGMYYYFPRKSEVLYYILTTYLDTVLGDLEKDLNELETPEEKIKFFIARHIQIFTNNQHEAKVLLHEAHGLPRKYKTVIDEKERVYFEFLANLVSELTDGALTRERLTATTFLLFGMCNWTYAWYSPKGPVTPEELSTMCWRLFLEGVRGIQQ